MPMRVQAREQGQDLRIVADLSSGGHQAHGIAQGIGASVDFRTHPAPAAAQAFAHGVAFFSRLNGSG